MKITTESDQRELVDNCLSVFQCFMDELDTVDTQAGEEQSNFSSYVNGIQDNFGCGGLREEAATLGWQTQNAYKEYENTRQGNNGQNDPWDIEILPWILNLLCELYPQIQTKFTQEQVDTVVFLACSLDQLLVVGRIPPDVMANLIKGGKVEAEPVRRTGMAMPAQVPAGSKYVRPSEPDRG
jgi:hypothetical protein